MSKSIYSTLLLVVVVVLGGYWYTKKTDHTQIKPNHSAVENIEKTILAHMLEVHNTLSADLTEAFSNVDVFGSLETQEKELIAQSFATIDTQQAEKLLSLFKAGGILEKTEKPLKLTLITLVADNIKLDEEFLALVNGGRVKEFDVYSRVELLKDFMNAGVDHQGRIKVFLKRYQQMDLKKTIPNQKQTIGIIKKLLSNPHFSDPLYPELFEPQ